MHEILLGSTGIASMIREGKTFQIASLMQSGQAQGMQTMDMALERFALAGKITPEAALEKASDKETLRRRLAEKFPQLAEASGLTAPPWEPRVRGLIVTRDTRFARRNRCRERGPTAHPSSKYRAVLELPVASSTVG